MARNPHSNQKSSFWSKNDFFVQNYCSHFHWVNFPTLVLRLHTPQRVGVGWTSRASVCCICIFILHLCMYLYLYFFPTLVLRLHTHTESGCSVVDQLSLCQLRSVNLTIRLQDPAAICLCVCICVFIIVFVFVFTVVFA